MISPFLIGIVVIYALVTLFCLSGSYLIAPISKVLVLEKKANYVLAYFAGLSVFVTFWRLNDFLFHSAKIGFVLSGIFLIVLSIIQIRETSFDSKLFKNAGLLIIYALFVQVLCTSFWTRQVYEDAYSTLGSGHSPRYANIALYALEIDRIPILGLNYVQSILSTVPYYFGGSSPLVYLSVWVGISVLVLSFLSYVILRRLKIPVWLSILGTLIVGFGNTALSNQQYLVMDTGSPFFLAGYSDTLHSIGTLVLCITMLATLALKPNSVLETKSLAKILFTLASAFFINTIMAPQSIVVTCAVAGLLFLYIFFVQKSEKSIKLKFLFPLFLLFITLGVGTRTGGFLTPGPKLDSHPIPGITSFNSSRMSPAFSPSMPYYLGNYYSWTMATGSDPFFIENETLADTMTRLSMAIVDSIYVLFFPLVGLLLCFIFRKTSEDYRVFFLVSILAFLCGFILVWPFTFYGSKWWLTRFFIPGLYFSQLCFVVGTYSLSKYWKKYIRIPFFIIATIFICNGPYNNFATVVRENFNNLPEFTRRLNSLVEYSKIPPEAK